MRLVVALALVAAAAAGCASAPAGSDSSTTTGPVVTLVPAHQSLVPAPAAPVALNQTAFIEVGPDTSLAVRPGIGWGRIEFHATERVTLNPKLKHDTMDDLSLFSDDGDGVYDELNFTFVYLFVEGESAFQGYYFQWWGTPKWSIWPHDSGEIWDRHGITLAAGETGLLIVGNTVPGYTISFGAQSGRALNWTMGPHPGFGVVAPDPTDSSLVAQDPVYVMRQRDWTATYDEVAPSLMFASAWNYDVGIMLQAGTTSDSLGCSSSTVEPTVPPLPFPQADYGTGGYSYSGTTAGYFFPDGAEIGCFRHLQENGVTYGDVETGAAFLGLPTA